VEAFVPGISQGIAFKPGIEFRKTTGKGIFIFSVELFEFGRLIEEREKLLVHGWNGLDSSKR
jgi:hypothetical protein